MDRLTRTWLILLALTLGTIGLGALPGANPLAPLGLIGAAVILLLSMFKARQVLWHFLDLRQAGGSWRTLLGIYLAVLVLAVFGSYAVAWTMTQG
jgi:hypothetical protein